MFSSLFFWFIWLFIFIPVLAWVLGVVLPIKSKDNNIPKDDSDPKKEGGAAEGVQPQT
ncbi:hypothetical protein K9N68_12365 [Kovacikia minuta CCNUW1]|uniref:hypothetical protein n=1 Tax=Kovacikia minuta TaxID=2931930 RepID=UPI001CCE0251|nr:hypothetical protein [Kovacikia minuta]UBF28594.1 hypothetical protein K9N68_12365 [Kovacikia minuta CCNUW1]